MACSGDGLATCPECSCDYSNDCSTCLGQGFVECEGCENCGPEPAPEDE